MAGVLDTSLLSTLNSDSILTLATGAPALTFNASTNSGAQPPGPFSFNHTCAGPNAGLIVFVTSYGAAGVPTGVTYNSVAMTNSGQLVGVNCTISVWSLINPTTGSSLAVAVAGASLPNNTVASAYSFTNANQTTLVGALASAEGTSANPSVVATSGAGQIIVAASNDFGGSTYSAPSGTSDFAIIAAAGQHQPGTITTASWTLSGSDNWIIGAISVKP